MAKYQRVLKKNAKTKLVLTLVLALSFALVSAGQFGNAATPGVLDPTAAQLQKWKSKTLTYLYFTDGPDEAATRSLVAKFEALTGAKVNIELVPFANLDQSLAARLAGKNAPDVARLTNPAPYKNDMLNLEKYFGRKYRDEFLAGTYTQVLNSSRQLVGVPYDITINGPFVNVDQFKKAGVPLPTAPNPWTWDTMIAAAKKVQAANNTEFAFAIDKSGHRVSTVLSQFGVYMIDKYGRNVLGTSRYRAEKALKTLTDLIKADIAPRDLWMGTGTKYAAANAIFLAQQVPVYLSGNWQVAALARDAKFTWVAVPNPCRLNCGGFPGGKFMVAFKESKTPDLAAYFVHWMNQPNQQASIDKAANWLPTRVDLAKQGITYPARSEDMNVFLADSALTPAAAYGWGSKGSAFSPAANALILATQEIVAGKSTVRQAVADLIRKIDTYLAAVK